MAMHFSPWLLLLVSTAFMASYMRASATDCRDSCKQMKSCCKSVMCAPSCRGAGCKDACNRCKKLKSFCRKRLCGETSCRNPGTVKAASRSGTTYKYGAKVIYKCNTGYERTAGQNTLTCGRNKVWNGTKLTCSKVSCGNPGNATGASHSATTYTYGATVTYTCNTGYATSTLTCGSNKAWIGIKPNCSSNQIGGNDCADIYTKSKGNIQSGVYNIKPFSSGAKAKHVVPVYCDMDTDGGGWTVFQRRFDGSVDFYQNWTTYANGFGKADGEYWLGLDILHAMTAKDPAELRVEIESFAKEKRYAKYGVFSVGDSASEYKLEVGTYSGDATDCMQQNNGLKFTTMDNDNDGRGSENCPSKYMHGGYWYNTCGYNNINGKWYDYAKVGDWTGLFWYSWKGQESMKTTEMKFRPISFTSG